MTEQTTEPATATDHAEALALVRRLAKLNIRHLTSTWPEGWPTGKEFKAIHTEAVKLAERIEEDTTR